MPYIYETTELRIRHLLRSMAYEGCSRTERHRFIGTIIELAGPEEAPKYLDHREIRNARRRELYRLRHPVAPPMTKKEATQAKRRATNALRKEREKAAAAAQDAIHITEFGSVAGWQASNNDLSKRMMSVWMQISHFPDDHRPDFDMMGWWHDNDFDPCPDTQAGREKSLSQIEELRTHIKHMFPHLEEIARLRSSIPKMAALAKDQRGKPEGETAGRMMVQHQARLDALLSGAVTTAVDDALAEAA